LQEDLAGSGDFLTLGLAAQVSKPPTAGAFALARDPSVLNCRRFVGKLKRFLALVVNRAALNPSRRFLGKNKEQL